VRMMNSNSFLDLLSVVWSSLWLKKPGYEVIYWNGSKVSLFRLFAFGQLRKKGQLIPTFLWPV
jgi:hypothetical protein